MISTASNLNSSPTRNNNAASSSSSELAVIEPPPNQSLSSRIIPKIGSIVKRFSLNYSGEGLVTDPQKLRTVRVGIRLQVQVDSFLTNNKRRNNTLASNTQLQDQPPRPITRTQSAPNSIYEGHFEDIVPVVSNFSGSDSEDSSSGVSSLEGSNPQSPVLTRRTEVEEEGEEEEEGFQEEEDSTFQERISQALTSSSTRRRGIYQRANSVCTTGSTCPDLQISTNSSPPSPSVEKMEDASSYQILRCFPGSNVSSVREFSWETAAFEKDVKDKVQWLGTMFRLPPFLQRLLSRLRTYASQHPVQALLILAFLIASALPVSIFLGFAIATILISFLGFLFIEGTLLTVASMAFGSVVAVVGFITLVVVVIGSFGYFTTSQVYSFFTGRHLKDLFHRLPLLGIFFDKSTDGEVASTSGKIMTNGNVPRMANGHAKMISSNSNNTTKPIIVQELPLDEDSEEEIEEDLVYEEGSEEGSEVDTIIQEDDEEEANSSTTLTLSSPSSGGSTINYSVLNSSSSSGDPDDHEHEENNADETLTMDRKSLLEFDIPEPIIPVPEEPTTPEHHKVLMSSTPVNGHQGNHHNHNHHHHGGKKDKNKNKNKSQQNNHHHAPQSSKSGENGVSSSE